MRDKVTGLLDAIRRGGDAAVGRIVKKFDGVSLSPGEWRVPAERLRAAWKILDPARRRALESAAKNVRRFHEAEKRHAGRSWTERRGGAVLGQRVRPVASAGLYVPGGRFAYPSTVLMTAIPARVAGVARVALCTPPQHLTTEVMAAAVLAGVDEVYRIGGVAAIGAMAYGTKTIKPVDMIVGPGGAWVTEAKRQVFGAVGIDALAGPSEIVVIADGSVRADFVAADLMAQAEHDPLARATMISTSARYLGEVRAQVEKKFRGQIRFIRAKSLSAAAARANEAAAEHLSLMVKDPESLLPRIANAGAAFLGPWSPVAAGDYWAGPSHVLPTGRAARFSSGLSVQTFLKRTSLIGLSRPALRAGAASIAAIARAEGLRHHAASVERREEKI